MKKLSALAVFVCSLFLCAAPSGNRIYTESYPGWKIVSIQDLPMSVSGKLFQSINPRERFRLAPFYRASQNVFLIQDTRNGMNALIDVGFGKEESTLLKQLAALGIKPDDISVVFITHIHPDHVGGLSTPEGKAVFPKARICIARKEYDEWRKDWSRSSLAKELKPVRKNLELVDYDKEVKPFGITPLYYPGHTPGHTVFRMQLALPDNKSKTIWFVGDIVHGVELQISRPQYCAKFDRDPATAVRSRRELLDKAAHWYGAHIPFPGIITIIREETPSGRTKYSFQSEPAKKPEVKE